MKTEWVMTQESAVQPGPKQRIMYADCAWNGTYVGTVRQIREQATAVRWLPPTYGVGFGDGKYFEVTSLRAGMDMVEARIGVA